MHVITGGSGSGKSAYAEMWLTGKPEKSEEKKAICPYLYIATMRRRPEPVGRKGAGRAGADGFADPRPLLPRHPAAAVSRAVPTKKTPCASDLHPAVFRYFLLEQTVQPAQHAALGRRLRRGGLFHHGGLGGRLCSRLLGHDCGLQLFQTDAVVVGIGCDVPVAGRPSDRDAGAGQRHTARRNAVRRV